MREAIKNFNKQFEYEPVVKNADKLGAYKKFIVAGMGGSHLAADILRTSGSDLDIAINNDYKLLFCAKDVLVICNSYSGNTEETISVFNEIMDREMPMAAVATGGKLLELARKNKIPHIQMPITGIQPRLALGFNLRALAKIMKREDILRETQVLAEELKPSDYESAGNDLAKRLKGRIPVIYSSIRNFAAAYNWKIKFNETGKIPAFCNIFPELNHNEMTGFDIKDSTRNLSERFYFIFLKDKDDHPKNIKRMEITEKLYRDRNLSVEIIEMSGKSRLHKIFSSLILADWASFYTAEQYGLEAEQVPMVEEFKKLIG
ncbi:MAG: bifunctional phosphoglucose/phosphomannose isomerase [Patescibacteria group bacterium]